MAEKAHHAADAAHEAASGGMPQFEVSNWGSQVFWLVVTFGVLYFVLSRFILPKLAGGIGERNDRIADDLDSAARMQREAEQAQADYERSLADARAKAHNISATTRSSVEAEIAAEVEAAEDELARKQVKAESHIANIRNEALKNVDSIASDATLDIVAKLAGLKPTAAALKAALGKG